MMLYHLHCVLEAHVLLWISLDILIMDMIWNVNIFFLPGTEAT